MKTRIVLFPCLVISVAVTSASSFAVEDAPVPPDAPKRPWTILLYGAVDNSADDPFVDFTDRVRRAIDDDPGVELVMFIDRSDEHERRTTCLGEDFSGSRLYRVRRDSVERLAGGTHFPEITKESEVNLDSADASTLQRFIAWGKAGFPAQKYALLIYSHADGRAMCPDERARTEMGIAESTEEIGATERVDFLALELCNMGGIEAAYQWRPGNGGFEADVLVAIPNAGPPLDWDRAFRRIRSPGHASAHGAALDPAAMSAADFGKLVIEEGHRGRAATVRPGGRGARESAGCYDLRHAGAVKKAIDALAVALATPDSRNAIVDLRNATSSSPGGRLMSYSEDGAYVDVYDLCRRVSMNERFPESVRTAASDVMKSMDEFMLASFGMSGYRGFEGGRNGAFIVLPSGAPDCWKHYHWYTPAKAERAHLGNWAFLRDGATAGNGAVENWFELLESWFAVSDSPTSTGATADSNADLERLQGTWTIVSQETRGQAQDHATSDYVLTIKGDEWIVTSASAPGREMKSTVRLDASTTPKALDMASVERGREQVTPCIYKLEGDTLTLRRATAEGDVARPREFATSSDEGMLLVWKRATK